MHQHTASENELCQINSAGSWVAVDWGTSSLRAWLIDENLCVQTNAKSTQGAGSLQPADFEGVLLDVIGDWLQTDAKPTQVFICGMAGSRQGWQEAEYVPVPTKLTDLHQHLDVMRGEETLLLGILEELSAIGAGTVLTAGQVRQVCAAGGTFVVSPNCDEEVIRTTKAEGMTSYPGVLTPTEYFAALKTGADALKIFPAFQVGIKGIEAVRAVLPKETLLYAVGGVGPADFADYANVGCQGFGMASNLYKPGFSAAQTAENAKKITAAYDAIKLGEKA